MLRFLPYAAVATFYALWRHEVKCYKDRFITNQLEQIDRLKMKAKQLTNEEYETISKYADWVKEEKKKWIIFPLFFSIRDEAINMKMLLSQEYNNDVLWDITSGI
jgi:hypothetical protein